MIQDRFISLKMRKLINGVQLVLLHSCNTLNFVNPDLISSQILIFASKFQLNAVTFNLDSYFRNASVSTQNPTYNLQCLFDAVLHSLYILMWHNLNTDM